MISIPSRVERPARITKDGVALLRNHRKDVTDAFAKRVNQLTKFKHQNKFYAKRLKEAGIPLEEPGTEIQEMSYHSRKGERSESIPVVRKKDTNYLGMFEFNMGDEKQLVRSLVYGKFFTITFSIISYLLCFYSFYRAEATRCFYAVTRFTSLRHFHVYSSR